jgi:hypothetical protein
MIIERLRIKLEAFKLLSELECNELLMSNRTRFRELVIATRDDVDQLRAEVIRLNGTAISSNP